MQKTPFSQMTSRERVTAAMKGLPQDRVPVFYWINPHAACKIMTDNQPTRNKNSQFLGTALWKWFSHRKFQGGDLPRALPILLEGYTNTTYAPELGSDIALLSNSDAYGIQKLYLQNGRMKVLDLFGSIRSIGGIYADVTEPAIRSLADLKSYSFCDFSTDKGLASFKKYRDAHPDIYILGASYGVQDLFITQLWNMQDALMAMIDHPEEVKAFQKRLADWAIDLAIRDLRAGADGILIYDDYGYTRRTMISLEMWKEFTLPHLKRIVSAIHEEGGHAVLHSCGFQMPLLPFYAGIELDALQTFQPKAGNDLVEAYPRYGDQFTFITGIDIQLGELMSPDQLREDILRQYQIGKTKNRFILGTTHELQFTMPDENIKTIFQTVGQIQKGNLG